MTQEHTRTCAHFRACLDEYVSANSSLKDESDLPTIRALTFEDIEAFVQTLIKEPCNMDSYDTYIMLSFLDSWLAKRQEALALRHFDLEQLQERARGWGITQEGMWITTWVIRRLDWSLWNLSAPGLPAFSYIWGYGWADQTWASFQNMEHSLRPQWLTLIKHCEGRFHQSTLFTRTASTSEPQWQEHMRRLIEDIGPQVFYDLATAWFERYAHMQEDPTYEATAIAGLFWGCAQVNKPTLIDQLQLILQGMQTPQVWPVRWLSDLAPWLALPEFFVACRPALQQLRAIYEERNTENKYEREIREIDWFFWGAAPELLFPFRLEGNWGRLIWASLQDMLPDLRLHWIELLRTCQAAEGKTSSKKWQGQVVSQIEVLGWETFGSQVTTWLGVYRGKDDNDRSITFQLKGLIWCCARIEDAALASSLADLALEDYAPGGVEVATACVHTLKSMPGMHGATQLERVRLKVKQYGYRKQVEKA